MISWAFEISVTFIEEFVLLSLIELLSEKRYKGAKQIILKIVLAIGTTLIITILNQTVSLFSFLTIIIGSAIPALLSKIICKDKYINLISIPIVYFLLMTIYDFMVAFTIEFLFIKDFVSIVMTTNGLERTLFIVGCKLTLIVAYLLIYKFCPYKVREVRTKILVFIDISSIVYYTCLNTVIVCILSDNISTVKRSITIALLFMMAFLIANIIFLWRYNIGKTKEVRFRMVEYQKDVIEQKYLQLNEMYRINAKNMHDYRNNIMMISQLLDNKKFDIALNYSQELYQELNKNRIVRTYTGVEIVDAILNVKVEHAQKHDIEMDIRASYPMVSTIEQVDICAILGNLLDNAIECSANQQIGKRKIKIKISYTNNIVVIKIQNYCSQNPFIKSKNLETTKCDKKIHGLGINIVKTTVKKYSGEINQSWENSIFSSDIIMYTDIQ